MSRLFTAIFGAYVPKLGSILSRLGTDLSEQMWSVLPGGGPDADGSRGSIRAATVKHEFAAGPASSAGAAGFQHGWVVARWAQDI